MEFILKVLTSYLLSIFEFLVTIFLVIWGVKLLYKSHASKTLYLGYCFCTFFIIGSIIFLIVSEVPKLSSLSGFCLLFAFLFFCNHAKSFHKFGLSEKLPIKSIFLPSFILPLFLIFLPFTGHIDMHDWGGLAFVITIWFWYPKAVLLGALISVFVFKKTVKINQALYLGCIAPILINLIFLLLI